MTNNDRVRQISFRMSAAMFYVHCADVDHYRDASTAKSMTLSFQLS
jgi:hypothetical protein